MRWEMGFSASEIASTAFSNPNIFRARGEHPPRTPPARAFGWSSVIADLMSGNRSRSWDLHNLTANWRGSPSATFRVLKCIQSHVFAGIPQRIPRDVDRPPNDSVCPQARTVTLIILILTGVLDSRVVYPPCSGGLKRRDDAVDRGSMLLNYKYNKFFFRERSVNCKINISWICAMWPAVNNLSIDSLQCKIKES
jgi:hypothetical protein